MDMGLLQIIQLLLHRVTRWHVNLTTLSNLPRVLQGSMDGPCTTKIRHRSLPLGYYHLHPFTLIFRYLYLLYRAIILRTTFSVVGTAPLANERQNSGHFDFF